MSARLRGLVAPLLVLAALVAFAWPEVSSSIFYPDSQRYIQWPSYVGAGGGVYDSQRSPSYPLLLKLVGPGLPLVHLQTWFSLACWTLLGWVLARTPGLLLGGLLALAAPVRLWNMAVLTESMTLSCVALIFALGVMLYRRCHSWLFGVWLLCVVYFAFLRDANALLLPFLAPPFLRHGWRRFCVVAALLIVVLAAAMIAGQLEQRWRIPYYTALRTRILPNPDAAAYFRSQGMPKSPPMRMSREMSTWMVEKGRSLYQRWVLTRVESYRAAWRRLRREGESEFLRRKYFERQLERVPAPSVAPVSEWLYRLSSPPRWLWLGFLCLPLLDWWRNREIGGLSLWVAALVPATYLMAFVTYHGAGTEVSRHMLLASILYRLNFFLALWVAVGCFVPAVRLRADARADRSGTEGSGVSRSV